MHYELMLKDEVVDRVPSDSLENAKMFFVQRKQMTEEQFSKIGYSVRDELPKEKKKGL